MSIIDTFHNFFFGYYISSNFIGLYRITLLLTILGYVTFIIKDIYNFIGKNIIVENNNKYFNFILFIILFYVFGIFSLIGLMTQLSILLFLIFFIILQKKLFYIFTSGANVICNILLLFLILTNCGVGLSIDNLIFNNYQNYVSGWAFRLIQISISFGYFFAGLNKIRSSHWRKGSAITNAVIYSNYGKRNLLSLFYPNTLQSKLACYNIMIFHLCAPILFWFEVTLPFAMVFAIITHIMMIVTLKIGYFGPIMIVAILSFAANYFQ